ncbi:MAG: AAA family ATPase [Planctomycetaceae bacterium]
MFGQKTQPTWFFRNSGHVEAVSRLMYLVESREPVGVITGPDGSGRSRVLERTALELQRTGESVVLMNLGGMEDNAALWQLAGLLCCHVRSSLQRHELLTALRDELAGRGQCGQHTTLLLDDLHRSELDNSVFLRFLMGIALSGSCPLTVIAAGRHEIPAELADHVYVPIRLHRLNHAESAVFARELLQRLGLPPGACDDDSIRETAAQGGGLPARLFRICDLIQVYALAWPGYPISAEIVRSLAAELAPAADDSRLLRPVLKMA